jgi:hypothetical protein
MVSIVTDPNNSPAKRIVSNSTLQDMGWSSKDTEGVTPVEKTAIHHRLAETQAITTPRSPTITSVTFNLSHFRAFPILYGHYLCGNGRAICSSAKTTVSRVRRYLWCTLPAPWVAIVASLTLRQAFHFLLSASQMVQTSSSWTACGLNNTTW